MSGAAPVLDWLKGTAPADPGGPGCRQRRHGGVRARAGCAAGLAYPPDAAGRTLFPFQRLFMVAQRG
ncbi:MAG: hypothetical protein U1E17_00950 [Geminicoccaceae bacterium]